MLRDFMIDSWTTRLIIGHAEINGIGIARHTRESMLLHHEDIIPVIAPYNNYCSRNNDTLYTCLIVLKQFTPLTSFSYMCATSVSTCA